MKGLETPFAEEHDLRHMSLPSLGRGPPWRGELLARPGILANAAPGSMVSKGLFPWVAARFL